LRDDSISLSLIFSFASLKNCTIITLFVRKFKIVQLVTDEISSEG
jgi:hypothetical protein